MEGFLIKRIQTWEHWNCTLQKWKRQNEC